MERLLTSVKVTRKNYYAQKVVFVDGQPGCGKTLFSPIVAAFDRVELLNYAYELEYACSLYYLSKIPFDSAQVLVRMFTDLKLYNTMITREINFRPHDLSAIWRNHNWFRYLQRAFYRGDESTIPERIKQINPILNLTTHNLLPFSEPIFAALGDRAVFIEIVRHPLYMIIQQSLNMKRILQSARDFSIYFEYKAKELPFYVLGWEEDFLTANDVEKTIYSMERLTVLAESARKMLREKYQAKIVTIPFERFIFDPWGYMAEIEKALDVKMSSLTKKAIKKQNVPRKMIAEGIALKIYKRCGWVPPESDNENHEFEKRRNFALKTASLQAMTVLDRICDQYEQTYFGKKIREGEHYE